MLYVKLKEDEKWYRVLDLIEIDNDGHKVYIVDRKGKVYQDEIERLEVD